MALSGDASSLARSLGVPGSYGESGGRNWFDVAQEVYGNRGPSALSSLIETNYFEDYPSFSTGDRERLWNWIGNSVAAKQAEADKDGFLGMGDLGNLLGIGGLALGGFGLAGMGPLAGLGGAGAALGEGAAWGAGLGGADLAAMEGAVGLMGEGAAWGAGLGGADLSAMESAVGGLGSAAGATGAAGGTAGTSGSSNAASALMRILKGEGKPDDYINVLGAAGPAALGMYGSSRQAEGLRDLSAANRADREPFLNAATTWLTNPGAYAAGPGQQTLDAVLRKLSAGFGNPIGAPTALGIATEAGMRDWRDAVTGMANLGLGGQDTRSRYEIGALGADKSFYDAIGAGMNDVLNPKKSLTDLLKELKGVVGTNGALA